ncbi:PE domain-containing protein [Pseudonocardia pini]|uniref:PE domain-containing protein n=1 Tax=Pseudonocardia pini TaxID=2758030 RepID=UPI0015F09C92|nr:PE domain-containing protein [Pseudonocardia pini]
MTAPRWDEAGPTPVVSPSAPGGVLRVDPEAIDAVMARLTTVADEIRRLERSLEPYAIASPGTDAVSVNGAVQANVMVERARSYLAEWHRHLILTTEALEQQRSGYSAADISARA